MDMRKHGGPIEANSKNFVQCGFPIVVSSIVTSMKLFMIYLASSSSKQLSNIPPGSFQYKKPLRMHNFTSLRLTNLDLVLLI